MPPASPIMRLAALPEIDFAVNLMIDRPGAGGRGPGGPGPGVSRCGGWRLWPGRPGTGGPRCPGLPS
ncbi:hypothetical protein GCE86_16895 [Micromonospora terminaliae]|uniref:Uncharacterized protein n=1 Tax=Micromonospora terminaliae TaxID=1914461 RepID=A0ABX6E4K1_9ACTN|nr:hypothetical protein GCE86_16895 [Micromonospora terminaliae]